MEAPLGIYAQRIDFSGDCWEWKGWVDRDGYGRRGWNRAHRFIYERLVGPVPQGHDLDHLCRNRLCVNPDHMEPVTHQENCRRSFPAKKTHCRNGHLYDAKNTYVAADGARFCRICNSIAARKYHSRLKAKAS